MTQSRFPAAPDTGRRIGPGRPVLAASELRHVAATGAGTFARAADGSIRLHGSRIEKPKADLLETALKARGPMDLQAFSSQLDRNKTALSQNQFDLLKDIAQRPLDDASDQEFEDLVDNVLKGMADKAGPGDVSVESEAPPQSAEKDPPTPRETPDRLQALLDAASRNRRAAVERAAQKEEEFHAAEIAVNEAWQRIKEETAKAGLQVGAVLLMKRGRISSAGLQSAMAERDRANAEATRLKNELHALRNEVADWNVEVKRILQRIRQGKPTG